MWDSVGKDWQIDWNPRLLAILLQRGGVLNYKRKSFKLIVFASDKALFVHKQVSDHAQLTPSILELNITSIAAQSNQLAQVFWSVTTILLKFYDLFSFTLHNWSFLICVSTMILIKHFIWSLRSAISPAKSSCWFPSKSFVLAFACTLLSQLSKHMIKRTNCFAERSWFKQKCVKDFLPMEAEDVECWR